MKQNESIKSEILDAVIECKRKNLNQDIQMTQVAALVGVSVRTINRYFPNKEDMIAYSSMVFLHNKYDEYFNEFSKYDDESLNGLERLIIFLKSLRNVYKDDKTETYLLVLATIKCIQFGLQHDIAYNEITDSTKSLVYELFALGQEDGSINPDLDLEQTVLLIAANFGGLIQRLILVDQSRISTDEKKHTYELFDQYIKMIRLYLTDK